MSIKMRSLIASTFIIFSHILAHAQDATSLQGTQIITPPANYPNANFQPCPNCAPLDGLSPVYHFNNNGFVFDVPHIAAGWSSWNTTAALVGNQWNWMDGPPTSCYQPPGQANYCFFRQGLVGYPNGGFWELTDGMLTFSTPSGTQIDIVVYMGTNAEPHTGYWLQPDMINGG